MGGSAGWRGERDGVRRAATGRADRLARTARHMARAVLPVDPENPCGPSLQARAGGGFSATLCNQAGGAGAGMGLPGPGAGSLKGREEWE